MPSIRRLRRKESGKREVAFCATMSCSASLGRLRLAHEHNNGLEASGSQAEIQLQAIVCQGSVGGGAHAVRAYRGRGRTDAVAADYALPLEVVLEAIAYCESCPPEIQEDWKREQASAKAGVRIKRP
jgi:hypothetical protein